MVFADNLKQLPKVSHLAAMTLLDAQGEVVGTIENKPGQAGSLAVYNHLAQTTISRSFTAAFRPKRPARGLSFMPSMPTMRGPTRASIPT